MNCGVLHTQFISINNSVSKALPLMLAVRLAAASDTESSFFVRAGRKASVVMHENLGTYDWDYIAAMLASGPL